MLLDHPFRHFTIELNQYRRGKSHFKPYKSGEELDHLGFWVDDVDRWARRLVQAGGRVKWKPFDATWPVPPGWPVPKQRRFKGQGAFVLDPDGIHIELMSPRTKPQPQRTVVPRQRLRRRQ